MHADRTNRTMLLILAVVLIGVGGLGAATSFSAFGTKVQRRRLSDNPVWRYFGAHGDWLWLLAAVLALVVIALSLRWLRALLLSTDRAGNLRIESEPGGGRTTVHPAAITSAVSEEIATYRGVQSARARLIGDADDPSLVVVATLEDSADLVELRRQIESGALTHARQALDNPALPIQLDLAVATKRSTRTR